MSAASTASAAPARCGSRGEIVRGCLMLAAQADGLRVDTIEGLSERGEIADLQAAFLERNALQCGYCTPGMLLTAAELLAARPRPLRAPRSAPGCRATIAAAPAIRRSSMRSRRSRPAGKGGRRERSAPMTGVSVLDRPNSYIGRSVPRPNARRLLHGRGRFVDDIVLPRMAHVAFLRSPFAHARIKGIDSEAAARSPGVIRVVDRRRDRRLCKPWVGVLAHLQGIKSAPQYPLAHRAGLLAGRGGRAVVASSRRAAEDALERLEVELEELPAVTDMDDRARPGDAGDPPRARRQPDLRAQARGRRRRRRVRRRRRRSSSTASASAVIPASRWSRARSSPTTTRPSIA